MRFARIAALASALVLLVARPPARAQDHEAVVGDAADALPGYVRTRIAGERPVGFAVTGAAGYGITDSAPGAPGPHHREVFTLGASGQPTRWLGVSLRLDGRADQHPNDGMGRDTGFIGTGALAIRASSAFPSGLAAGAQLTLLAFGGDAPSLAWDALSVEGTALLSYRSSSFSVAGELGYRVDRSARTIPPGALFRPGDRLALGVSEFDAILIRVGAGYRKGRLEALAELAWDLLLDGPSAIESPIHAAVGARYHPNDALQLELVLDASLSDQPNVRNGEPFVVIDPRFTARLAVTYRYGRRAADETTGETDAGGDGRGGRTGRGGRAGDGDGGGDGGETAEAPTRTLAGTIVDERGAPVIDAHVVVRAGDTTRDGYTGADGRFAIDGIPVGEASVVVTAAGHAPVELALGDGPLALPRGTVTLEAAAAAGVVRGLVRDFEGRPVRATIRIRPTDRTARADADGHFQIELPPGTYTVTVEANGFQSQSREVRLSRGEVTIYNVDLRRGR